jgi:hypothetical protein
MELGTLYQTGNLSPEGLQLEPEALANKYYGKTWQQILNYSS